MAQKPSIPKGTRDFGPIEMAKRNYIFDTIRRAFTLFGYAQIETPAMENLQTLMGKYGDEGDKLLFKILNSGDFLKDVASDDLEAKNLPKLMRQMCEKGLRYDLTVPFARFVVQHRNDIQMPFKRFQIQPVWRADRPQKGRYREFFQCDADVVGSESLLNEVELLMLADHVFSNLSIRVAIKINNRKILSGIAELIGYPDKIVDITVAIDKIDKVGLENVEEELRQKGIDDEAIAKLRPLLTLTGSNAEKLATISSLLSTTADGQKGIEELEYVVERYADTQSTSTLEIDISLARGLNYYTGTIIEIKALDVEIGSISGGGRYDNLTGVFGMPGISGVGISFGADRIYDVLNQLDLYPAGIGKALDVLFVNFGDKESRRALNIIATLHKEGISAELYPDTAKMKKQMALADNLNVPYVAIIGETELANDTITLKTMSTGEQKELTLSDLISLIKKA